MSIQPTLYDDARPVLVAVSKPGGGQRILTILGPEDEARYRSVVARVAGLVERALSSRVMANRVAPGTALQLEPWRPAWRRLLREREELARRGGGGGAILRADVRRCYPSIGSAAVARALLRFGADRDDVRSITHLLDRFQEDTAPGLPIGPDPSAVLANAVLVAADEALAGAGAPHARWVDDVWASAKTRAHAERALDVLRGALARVGLALNEEKTMIDDAPGFASRNEGSASVAGL